MIQYLQFMLTARRSDERGATAVEYGLLVALIAAVIVTVVFTLGGHLQDAFTTVSNKISNPSGGTAPASS